jgi:hypothetical protein
MAMPNLHLRRFVIDFIHRRQQVPAGQLHVWSAVLIFNNVLSDSQLLDICKLAHGQMTESYDSYPTGLDDRAKPPVITIMMGPNRTTVILASSMKKVTGVGTPGKYHYANGNLKELLDKRHRY